MVWPASLAAPLAAALAALIQLGGTPLAGGTVEGGARVSLEKAVGGDTPVVSFTSPRGPVRLLLDTGASSAMVTPALADRLRLNGRPVPPGSFELAGGGKGCANLRPQRVRLPPLALGGNGASTLRLIGAEALVLPVEALPSGVDGVLGAPSLRQMPVRIDPRRHTMSLGPPALQVTDPPRQRLPLRWHMGVPLLTLATVAGPVAALADTGAEGLFLSPGLAARLHPLGHPRPLRLVGFCGEQAVQRQPFAGIALPGEALPGVKEGAAVRPVEGIVTVNPIFSELGVEAIVGQELLRDRTQLWRLDRNPPVLELW